MTNISENMKFQKIHFSGAPEVPALGVHILPESMVKPRPFNAYLGNIHDRMTG